MAIAASVGCAGPPAAQPKRHADLWRAAPSAAQPKRHVDLWPAAQQEALPRSNVSIAIDCVLIRSHPLGARAMAALASLPEWKQFAQGASLDPSQDVDGIFVTGPSLIDARRDAVAIRYSARDEDVERAIVALTSQRTGSDSSDSSLDVGFPNVKGWRLSTRANERAFLRGPKHILAVVPSKYANAYARELSNGALDQRPVDGAAVSLRATSPSRSWSFLPKELVELRARIAPRPDGGAELFAEGDFPDEASAAAAAAELEKRLGFIASGGAEESGPPIAIDCRADGLTVKGHVSLARADLDGLFDFVMVAMRVTPAHPPTPPSR